MADEGHMTHHMAAHAHPGMAGIHNMGAMGMNMNALNGHHMPHHAETDLARKYNFGQKLDDHQLGSQMTLNLVKTEALTSPYLYANMDHHHHHAVTSV